MGPMGAMGGMGPKGKGGPAKGAMAMATPCRFGANCVRQGCMFQHPQGYTPGPGMQKGPGAKGGKKGEKGKGAGPESWFGKADEPCRFGDKCTRPGCFFVHPPGFKVPTKGEGKGGKAGTPCRNGADCKRPDCYFAHPAVCLPVMGGEATEEKKEEEAA